MSKPTLKVTVDNTEAFKKAMRSFAGDAVLVGIPEVDTKRKEEKESGKNSPINNATLLMLNEYGSPANNIPPRPVMTIGLKNAQDKITEYMKKAAQTFFLDPRSTVFLERAGFTASHSIKKAINDQDSIPGPSEATLAARKAKGFKGVKSLIVTGQMRNAITHVLTGLWSNVQAMQKKKGG